MERKLCFCFHEDIFFKTAASSKVKIFGTIIAYPSNEILNKL